MNTQPQEKALTVLQERVEQVMALSKSAKLLMFGDEPCVIALHEDLDTLNLEGLVKKAILDLEEARDNLSRVIGFLSR